MPADLLMAFLCVLARVAGVFTFLPLPGLKRAPDMARVVFALAATMALYPQWPRVAAAGPAQTAMLVAGEAALGVTVGLVAGFLMEALLVGAQVLGLQAGFSYAAMINPTTEDESAVLLVLAELAGGMLFFALGLERRVLGALAASLETYPPGAFAVTRAAAETIGGMGAVALATGMRLAFPVVALLLMVDVGLALMGRLQPSLQLLILAFPAKMLAGLLMLAWTAWLFPRLYESCARELFGALARVTGL
ncbi:MAG: flagellar biosynthetic protein FliR [Bryobacteraceae bacterium]